MTNAIATVGHNLPEEASYEAYAAHIDDLMMEARNFLDGEAVETQEAADAVGKIMSALRTAKADAEKARKVEKEPHLEAGRAVDAKWKGITERADKAVLVAKEALAPFLKKQDDERQAEERRQREIADRLRKEAMQERQTAAGLEAREAADAKLQDAEAAERAANKANKAKAHATGEGRAVGLRTYKVLHITDEKVLAKHYWQTRHEDVIAFYRSMAEADMRLSKPVPGTEIKTERAVA